MRKTVKVVNGYDITKMEGTKGHYTVYVTSNKFASFKTIKEASTFCETLGTR